MKKSPIMYIVMYGGQPLLFSTQQKARTFFDKHDADTNRGGLFKTIVDATPEEIEIFQYGAGNPQFFTLHGKQS